MLNSIKIPIYGEKPEGGYYFQIYFSNIFFILIQFSFLQIKGFFLYNKIPINWYFITNNHSISLLCPKHENKSITYKSCKQIHDQHNKINRFCIFAICIYAKSYKFLYQ